MPRVFSLPLAYLITHGTSASLRRVLSPPGLLSSWMLRSFSILQHYGPSSQLQFYPFCSVSIICHYHFTTTYNSDQTNLDVSCALVPHRILVFLCRRQLFAAYKTSIPIPVSNSIPDSIVVLSTCSDHPSSAVERVLDEVVYNSLRPPLLSYACQTPARHSVRGALFPAGHLETLSLRVVVMFEDSAVCLSGYRKALGPRHFNRSNTPISTTTSHSLPRTHDHSSTFTFTFTVAFGSTFTFTVTTHTNAIAISYLSPSPQRLDDYHTSPRITSRGGVVSAQLPSHHRDDPHARTRLLRRAFRGQVGKRRRYQRDVGGLSEFSFSLWLGACGLAFARLRRAGGMQRCEGRSSSSLSMRLDPAPANAIVIRDTSAACFHPDFAFQLVYHVIVSPFSANRVRLTRSMSLPRRALIITDTLPRAAP